MITLKKHTLAFLLASALIQAFPVHGQMPLSPAIHWGRYDGSYNPSSTPPPTGNDTWVVYLGGGASINPNNPTEGVADFKDTETDSGSRFSLDHYPGSAATDRSDLSTQPWEYEMALEYLDAGGTLLYNTGMAVLAGGFMHDGGDQGKSVRLGWFRDTVSGERFLAFVDPRTAGAISTISYFNWQDNKPHRYSVKKYRDSQTGEFVVQVLIDGVPQLSSPIPYASFPSAGTGKANFSFGTPSSKTCHVLIDEIVYGPLTAPPSERAPTKEVVTDDAAISVPSPPTYAGTEKGVWVLQGGKLAEIYSGEMKLTPNRLYTIRGSYSVKGMVEGIGIKLEQYSQAFRESGVSAKPTQLAVPTGEDKRPFEFQAYLKKENDRATLHLSAEGNGTVEFQNLTISGGGPYRPSIRMFPAEKPAFSPADISSRIGKLTEGSGRFVFQDGMPRIVTSNGDLPPFFYAGPMISKKNLGAWGAFGRAGVHLQSGHISKGSMDMPQWWKGKNQYDFRVAEQLIQTILSRDSDARIILNVWVDPYDGWGNDKLDDVVQNSTGLYGIGGNHFSKWGRESGTSRLLPSIFSRKVAADTAQALAALENWLNGQSFGKSVVGLYLWGFNDADFGHWVHPGTSKTTDLDDYSPAALDAWQKWLKDKYAGDIVLLRESWGDAGIQSFDSVALPTLSERRANGTEGFPWLLSRNFKKISDFNSFYGQAPAMLLAGIISDFRAATKTKRFILSHVGTSMHGWRGYTGFGKLAASGELDGFCATSDYSVRMPGYSGGGNSYPASLALRQKLFFHEFDYRSYCAPSEFEDMDFGCGRANDSSQHRAMLLRETSNMLAQGQGMYCLDMMGTWYGDPDLMRGVKEANSLFSKQMSMPGKPQSDMAFFVGEESINYLGDNEESSRFLKRVTRRQRPEWDTAGVPYHLYLQSDLTNPELPEYKIYVFVLPQKISAKEREAIEKLKRGNKTLVFFHAPGICDSENPEETIGKITGMKVRRHSRQDATLAGTWLESGNPLLRGLAGNFGDRPMQWPFMDRPSRGLAFVIDDPEATPLATYKGSQDVAVASREFGTWRSIYMAVPWLQNTFISNLAKSADAWSVATPGDAVFANQHFIGIHATQNGLKTLRPFRTSRISDALTGEVIANKTSEFEVQMSFGETRIFRCEESPLSPWERLLQFLSFSKKNDQ